jgi:SSS family solute:Na+ symporter
VFNRSGPEPPDTGTIVPAPSGGEVPSWFAGIAFAAIGIGALVPAAIMSVAAANLWTRNVDREHLRRDATRRRRPGGPGSLRWW